MLYLNHEHMVNVQFQYNAVIEQIAAALASYEQDDFDQPIKPYLSFENPRNRIIAMPARLGGEVQFAGLKWIASFPQNIENGIPRANSVTILNDIDTGVPVCIVNTAQISAIRTAAVSGLMIQEYLKAERRVKYQLAIIGFGIIGREHLKMLADVMDAESIDVIRIYEVRDVDNFELPNALADKIEFVDSWQSAFDNADILMTSTTSSAGYIDTDSKPGAIYLNVSLRDFKPAFAKQISCMVVDKWEEVCRQGTDVEAMHLAGLLQKEQSIGLEKFISQETCKLLNKDDVIMFNPMGMAIFDIVTAAYFFEHAMLNGYGQPL